MGFFHRFARFYLIDLLSDSYRILAKILAIGEAYGLRLWISGWECLDHVAVIASHRQDKSVFLDLWGLSSYQGFWLRPPSPCFGILALFYMVSSSVVTLALKYCLNIALF